MYKLEGLKPEAVFRYFEEISAIPRGSGHCKEIADYCEEFAKKRGLTFARDELNNVVIYKGGSLGYEDSAPVILQGHLDIVWQKAEDSDIDLENDGLRIMTDGEFVTADGTTLGADNGIAVAMIMAILDDNTEECPPIEAVFTTDEEIGLIGATGLDISLLKGRKMINIDSEEPGVLTVSCAGGSDFSMKLPLERRKQNGGCVTIAIKGLAGGHSGIEINAGRVNANILAGRILNHLRDKAEIISIDGGNKGNAIANACTMKLLVKSPDLCKSAIEYLQTIKDEISRREPEFFWEIEESDGEFDVIDSGEKIIDALLFAPNGVCEMSASISGLVETSLNLGVLKTDNDVIEMKFALRSNIMSALKSLEDKMTAYAKMLGFSSETGGHYPPWEFRQNSDMQKLCLDTYREMFGRDMKVEAIHAGLECATFSGRMPGLDCVSIGPAVLDAHTVNEKLGIKSTEETFEFLKEILKKCK